MFANNVVQNRIFASALAEKQPSGPRAISQLMSELAWGYKLSVLKISSMKLKSAVMGEKNCDVLTLIMVWLMAR